MSIPFVSSTGTATGGSLVPVNLPVACPQSGQTLEPLTIQHPYPTTQQAVSGINASAVNQLVASPSSNLTFLTYTGIDTGATLPYYLPGSNGAAGVLNYVCADAVARRITAPVAGAFSPDNTLFFVSTSGDNLIHFIDTSTFQDTQADQSRLCPPVLPEQIRTASSTPSLHLHPVSSRRPRSP